MNETIHRHTAAVKLSHQKDELALAITQLNYNKFKTEYEAVGFTFNDILNYSYHDLSKLYTALLSGRSDIFSNYIIWFRIMLEKRNVPLILVYESLDYTEKVLSDYFEPEQMLHIKVLFDDARAKMEEKVIDPPSFLEGSEYIVEATKYFHLILNGSLDEAEQTILDILQKGDTITNILKEIFIPVQRESGRLWQLNKITVADEHLITETTRRLLFKYSLHEQVTEKIPKKILLAGVGGELHDMGILFLDTILRHNGFQTVYLGGNIPVRQVIAYLQKNQIDAVAISCTISVYLRMVQSLIQEIKNKLGHTPKIIVGGQAFIMSPNLWQIMQADGFVSDAFQAPNLLRNMLYE